MLILKINMITLTNLNSFRIFKNHLSDDLNIKRLINENSNNNFCLKSLLIFIYPKNRL